jgi:hypothetical protein
MGSGRLLLALFNRIKDMGLKFPVLYYGADRSTIAYRMAILNFKLHGLNSQALNLDYTEYDVRSFSPNWKYANSWKPVQEKKLFTEKETDDMGLRTTGDLPTIYYPK